MTKGELVDALEAMGFTVSIGMVWVPRHRLGHNIEASGFSIDATQPEKALETARWYYEVSPQCGSYSYPSSSLSIGTGKTGVKA